MKFSKFNLWVEDYPNKGEYVVFNARTQALVKINRSFKKDLDEFLNLQPVVQNQQMKDSLDALRDNGILVKDDSEEEMKLKDFFRQLQYESNTLPFEVTLLTTYSCNFKCVYCFEESVKNNVFLDKDTAQATIKFLIKTIEKKGFKRISLVYYGGEPLLNTGPIYDISRNLMEWSKNNGVEFGFSIITNGSLITPGLIDKFLTVGLKQIRISIDGAQEAHNQKRPFSDGSPSFDIILHNIKSVIDKVGVGITGNFDRQNVESIPRLLDYLEAEGILRKLQRIDFAPLAPRLGPKSNPGAIELSECLLFVDKDGLFREVIAVKKELMRRGIPINTGLAVNACALIMRDGGITIDPEGKIYKCNALLGYPEFSIGDVRDEEFNGRYREFLGIDAWNKCLADCPYVPMCQGGCRFFSYLENKNFSDVSCKREYLDRIIPELIKLEYDKLCTSR